MFGPIGLRRVANTRHRVPRLKKTRPAREAGAEPAGRADLLDRASQRPAHRPAKSENVHSSGRPSGNSAAAFLRRLRTGRPDLHARAGGRDQHPCRHDRGWLAHTFSADAINRKTLLRITGRQPLGVRSDPERLRAPRPHADPQRAVSNVMTEKTMTRRNKLLGTIAMPNIEGEAPKIEDDLNGAIGAASGESEAEAEDGSSCRQAGDPGGGQFPLGRRRLRRHVGAAAAAARYAFRSGPFFAPPKASFRAQPRVRVLDASGKFVEKGTYLDVPHPVRDGIAGGGLCAPDRRLSPRAARAGMPRVNPGAFRNSV